MKKFRLTKGRTSEGPNGWRFVVECKRGWWPWWCEVDGTAVYSEKAAKDIYLSVLANRGNRITIAKEP
jgi:hypothetical protein